MFAECQLESIQRIHALRTELDNSLITNDSPERQQQFRQLRTVFRSDEAVHIQFSGLITEEEQTSLQNVRPSSRFTVSPTPPSALPSFASSIENRKQALHVLIAKPIFEESKNLKEGGENKKFQTPNSIVVPPPTSQSVASASSPASSIDSGVASPGSCTDEFLLFGTNSPFSRHRNSLPNPLGSTTWESQTLPKARGRVFNFATTAANKSDGFSSLIEALSLLPGAHRNEKECKTSREEFNKNTGDFKPFELQNPPIGKSHNQLERSSTTSFLLQKYNSGIGEERKGSSLDNGLPPRSATMPPLKSILKKKQSIGASNPSIPTMSTPFGYSNQRKGGMFSRFVPFRSISEDHVHDEQRQRSPPLYKNSVFSIINKNNISSPIDFSTSISSSNGTIEEEEIDSGIADCFYCSSDNNNIKNGINQQQKQKRVSFSEQVQARVYRSTSSILGQRKKNEKKARSRATRRCNSDESETNSFDVTNDEFERSSFLGIYHSQQDNQSTKNNGNIICKSMASSTSGGSNTNGANSGGLSVLAQ